MKNWKRIIAKLHNLFANQRAEEELAREVDAHLTLLADDFERSGMPAQEARQAALRAYGGVEQAKQAHWLIVRERGPLFNVYRVNTGPLTGSGPVEETRSRGHSVYR